MDHQLSFFHRVLISYFDKVRTEIINCFTTFVVDLDTYINRLAWSIT